MYNSFQYSSIHPTIMLHRTTSLPTDNGIMSNNARHFQELQSQAEKIKGIQKSSSKRLREVSNVLVDEKKMKVDEKSDNPAFPSSSIVLTNRHDDGFYSSTIFQQKYALEKKYVLRKPIFTPKFQDELSLKSYQKLFCFLFDIYVDQRLNYSTFLMAMSIINQMISKQKIPRTNFLLLGCAAISLAGKAEEIFPPCVDFMISLAYESFNKQQLYNMERMIFQSLSWTINFPTRHNFAQHYAIIQALSKKQLALYDYLLGLSYCQINCAYYEESKIAAAALHYTLQLTTVDEPVWSTLYIEHTTYTERDLIDIIFRLRACHWQARDYPIHSFINYFMDESRNEVANIFALPYNQLRLARVSTTPSGVPQQQEELTASERMAIYAYYGLPKNEQLYDIPDFAKGNGIPPYAITSSSMTTNSSSASLQQQQARPSSNTLSKTSTTTTTTAHMNTKNIEQLLFGNGRGVVKKGKKTTISPVSTVDSVLSQ